MRSCAFPVYLYVDETLLWPPSSAGSGIFLGGWWICYHQRAPSLSAVWKNVSLGKIYRGDLADPGIQGWFLIPAQTLRMSGILWDECKLHVHIACAFLSANQVESFQKIMSSHLRVKGQRASLHSATVSRLMGMCQKSHTTRSGSPGVLNGNVCIWAKRLEWFIQLVLRLNYTLSEPRLR